MDHLSQLGTSPAVLLLHQKANSALVSQAEGKVGCLNAVTQSLDTLSIMMINSLPLSDALPHLIPGVWVFTSEYFKHLSRGTPSHIQPYVG